jgi:predicted nucleic acid-binding protein
MGTRTVRRNMNKNSAILIDTDILVDYLRGTPEAVRYLEELDVELKLSVINIAELF